MKGAGFRGIIEVRFLHVFAILRTTLRPHARLVSDSAIQGLGFRLSDFA